jgi:hypothetical protein
MSRRSCIGIALLASAVLVVSDCGSDGDDSAQETKTSGNGPEDYVARVDNPWFPLTLGTTFVYRGVKDGRPARDVVKVTRRTRMVQGVRCTVVHDELYLGGRLAERTDDWYAQDRAGNVWYMGEATAELDNDGKVKTTEGSWEAGVDGAEGGIFMPAAPKVGQSYRQEYYKGQAEDHFQVLRLDATVKVPSLTSRHALLSKEWTPLEPDVIGHKLYVRGIGLVKEETIKGGSERVVLVALRRP